MKLSFSLSRKPSSKPKPKLPATAQSAVEFITEFDGTRTLTNPEKPMIAPLPNAYNPHKRMKNLDAVIRRSGPTNPEFEVESADAAGPDISYGLNLRDSGNSDTTRVSVDAVMLQKLKQDLRDLPDGPGMDEYEDMPVEGFGAALLAGYGWHEGRGIGRNARGDVNIVQYERRTGKEGLGFIADMPSVNQEEKKSRKRSRGGEERKEVREKRLEKNKQNYGPQKGSMLVF